MAPAGVVRIHLSLTALIVPAMLFVCVVPLATAGGWWGVMFALPAVALLVILVAGTTATPQALSTRWLHGWTRVPWNELQQIEFPDARWAVAVTTSGRRLVLPGVRPADLPRIVAAAGSRLFLRRAGAARPDQLDPARSESVGPPADGAAGAPDSPTGRETSTYR